MMIFWLVALSDPVHIDSTLVVAQKLFRSYQEGEGLLDLERDRDRDRDRDGLPLLL